MRYALLLLFICYIHDGYTQNATVHASQLAFIVNKPGLHIESIAYDSKTKKFYLGSINKRKIVVIDSNGNLKDFIQPAQDGIWTVLGMKVDPTHHYLWVSSTAYPYQEAFDSTDEGKTGIFKYDVQTGKLIRKYILYEPGKRHAFGDLTIDKKGTVYTTDSDWPAVFKLEPGKDSLELIYKANTRSLQGLALDDSEKHLFVADYVAGLFRLDLQNNNFISLHPSNTAMPVKGIDGLYFYKNKLIGIHNGSKAKKVLEYQLGAKQDSIVSYRVVDENNPDLDEPTLGTIINNRLYFVANSPWNYYNGYQLNETGKSRKMKILFIRL